MATALRANRIVPSFESLQFPGQPAEPAPYRIRPNQQPREPSKQASDSRDPAGKTHSLEREGDQFPSFDPTSGFRFCRKARIPGSQVDTSELRQSAPGSSGREPQTMGEDRPGQGKTGRC